MTKPSIYFPIVRELYAASVLPVVRAFEAAGHKCSHEWEGQDIMIGSDAGDDCDAALKFNLNHGFGAKNIYWGTNGTEREQKAIQLVPSRWYARRLQRCGVPALVVGMPRLDIGRKCRTNSEKSVLYAPTCHVAITSIPMVDRRVLGLSGYGYKVRVRLHPAILESGDQASDLARLLWGNTESEDSGVLVAKSKVTICDLATTLLDAIVLDKPAIVMQPPSYTVSEYFNVRNPEWVLRNVQYVAHNWYEAKQIFKRLHKKDDPKAELRRRVAPFLCEHVGEAAHRCYDAVMGVWNAGRNSCRR